MRLIDADGLKDVIVQNVYPIVDAFNSHDYGMFWTGGIEKAIDEQPTVNQWIPCSERLPEPNRHDALNVDVYYLAQTEFGDMIVASYNESHEGTKWWEQMYSYRIFDDEIVAWMPLPEPYKEVTQMIEDTMFDNDFYAVFVEEEHKKEKRVRDNISRQAAIYIASGYCHPANIAEELRKLPSAERWIPVSEGLPRYDETSEYLVTDKGGRVRHCCLDPYMPETFVTVEEGMIVDAVAWRPAPEPWKGDENE